MAEIITTIQVATSIISSLFLCMALGFSIILYRRLRDVSSMGMLLLIIFSLLLAFNVLEALEHGFAIASLEDVQDAILIALGAFLLAVSVALYYQLPAFPALIRATQQRDHQRLSRWLREL